MGDLDVDALREQLQGRLIANESMDDVVAATLHLAERRAAELGREPEQTDLEYAASILCWYPFKTPPAPNVQRDLRDIRSALVRGASDGDVGRLDAVVPDRTLTAGREQLADWQQTAVTNFLDIQAEGNTQADLSTDA